MNLDFRFATDDDTQSVINLWNLCFPDESGFNEYFFDVIYRPEYNLLLFKDGILCSMAQMLPYELKNNDKIEQVTYIYGACTHPDFRRQHLMDRLLNYSFELDKNNSKSASILIPQEQWLFDFYAKFGYKPVFHISSCQLTEYVLCENQLFISNAQEKDIDHIKSLYDFNLSGKIHVIRNKDEWKKQIDLFNSCGGKVLCMNNIQSQLVGFAFVWTYKNSFYVQELMCKSGYQDSCIHSLQKYFSTPCCKVSGLQFSNMSPLGCMCRHDNTDPINGYINLMLN